MDQQMGACQNQAQFFRLFAGNSVNVHSTVDVEWGKWQMEGADMGPYRIAFEGNHFVPCKNLPAVFSPFLNPINRLGMLVKVVQFQRGINVQFVRAFLPLHPRQIATSQRVRSSRHRFNRSSSISRSNSESASRTAQRVLAWFASPSTNFKTTARIFCAHGTLPVISRNSFTTVRTIRTCSGEALMSS